MITPEYGAQLINGKYVRPETFIGLSTDIKPTVDVANGAIYIAIDTSTLYFFDLANTAWRKWGKEE